MDFANGLSKASVELRFDKQKLTEAEPQAGPTDQTGCELLIHKSQSQIRGRRAEAEAGSITQKQEERFMRVA